VPSHEPAVWIGFTALIAGLLVLDLGVLNRRSHVLSFKEAISWSAGLVGLALAFGLFLLVREGPRSALEYYTGYLIELSLSVDNLFVFILIFQYFAVPSEFQPRILKWGILGAMVMRGVMIALGALLLQRFSWIIYVFGGILVLTGIRMFRGNGDRIEPERNPIVRLARRFIPMSDAYDGQRFFSHTRAGWTTTPLLLVLIVVEWSDLVFAILGLRALFFVLAGMMDRFEYLKPGVATILIFVGLKMVLNGWLHMPIGISLGVVVTILVGSVILSLRKTRAAL